MDIDIESYMTSLNLESICRTCLTESEEMASVFSEVVVEASEIDDEMETSFLYEILMNISSIQILTNDGLPNLICKKCMEYASNAFKFKLQCERSEALLQTYAATKIHIKEENDIMKNELVEDVSEQEQIKLKDDSNLDLMPPTIENSIMIQEIIEDGMQETKDEVQDSEKQMNIDDVDDLREVFTNGVPEPILSNELELAMLDLQNDSMCTILSDENISEVTKNESAENTALKLSVSTNNNEIKSEIEEEKIPERSKKRKSKNIYKKSDHSNFYPLKTNNEGKKVYSCNICDKEFNNAKYLTIHLRTHVGIERPYACKECGKSFKDFWGLRHHMFSHSEEKPHACTLCSKRYRHKGALTSHMLVHTGERPYLCTECGKGFRQATSLDYHMRFHTDEKPYMCSDCGKCYKMQSHLVQHMRSHTGERPFLCRICDKTFITSNQLKRHQIIHSGVLPYVCEVCQKAFNRKGGLRVHEMTHTNERPHVCSFCGKGFIQAHCLKTHLKTHKKEVK